RRWRDGFRIANARAPSTRRARTARSDPSVRRGRWDRSPSDGASEGLAQLAHREADSRFHGAERLLETIGNLDVAQPLEIRKLDRDTLQHRKIVDRGADAGNLLGGEKLMLDR